MYDHLFIHISNILTTGWPDSVHTMYNKVAKTLLFILTVNPPAPMPCPIRGRYKFSQKGPETELFKTRIRGITERPRHMIDCREYTSEIKSCDENPTKMMIDAEYCESLDHTGRPVGEYGE